MMKADKAGCCFAEWNPTNRMPDTTISTIAVLCVCVHSNEHSDDKFFEFIKDSVKLFRCVC